MKKILVILISVGMIASWPAATWLYAGRAQASSEQLVTAITQAVPYIAISNNEYQKGFLSSAQLITFRPVFRGVGDALLPELKIKNTIEHGPFPGFSSVGAARIKHEIVWPQEAKTQIAKLWGQQEPLIANTQISLGGGGKTILKSPAATAKIGKSHVAFQGLDGVMNFSPGFGQIDHTLSMLGLLVDDSEAKLALGKIAASGAHTKVAGTEKIYVGRQTMSLASVDITAKGQSPLVIGAVDYVVETALPEPNLLSGTGKFTNKSVRYGTSDLGAVDLRFSMSKMHAPTLELLAKDMQAEFNKMTAASTQSKPMSASPLDNAMLKAMQKHLPALSKHVPKFNVDTLRLGNEKDYVQINGMALLKPLTQAEASNPVSMLPKLDASLNIEVSESVLQLMAAQASSRMLGDQADSMAALPPEQRAQMETQMREQSRFMVDQQIGQLVQQGYIVRSVGKVSAQIALKEGNLTLNGKPVGQSLLPTK